MADEQQGTLSAIARFLFKAQNTDELSFAKNDLIILTQTPSEGGWWEGTFNGKTGWFPANYVEQIVKKTESIANISTQQCVEMHQHRETILENLLESEQQYINELEEFLTKIIQPLTVTVQLDVHNLDELFKFHRHLLQILQDSLKTQHRIGAIFLHLAPTLKPIFEEYCSQHAQALSLLNQNKEKIANQLTKIDPSADLNQLIKKLSLPVNRLERYAGLLQEYLNNLEEFHIDRGDAQRAAEYYAELASSGADWRKRKEWELDIVHSLGLETLASYGDALCLSPVNVILENNSQTSFERIAILYPTILLLLSSSTNQQEYQIENRLPINQITISKIIDISKRALKINLPPNQSFIISYPSSIEYQEWCEKFYSLLITTKSQSIVKSPSTLTATKSAPTNLEYSSPKAPLKNPHWSKSCLRPHSPFTIGSGSYFSSTNSAGNESPANVNEGGPNRTLKRFMTMKKSKANDFLKRVETSGGDSLLLSVIEAYCLPTTSNATAITNLNHLLSKTRHSMQENLDPVNLERRAMQDMLNELRLAYKNLQQELDEERRARKQLESQIQKFISK